MSEGYISVSRRLLQAVLDLEVDVEHEIRKVDGITEQHAVRESTLAPTSHKAETGLGLEHVLHEILRREISWTEAELVRVGEEAQVRVQAVLRVVQVQSVAWSESIGRMLSDFCCRVYLRTATKAFPSAIFGFGWLLFQDSSELIEFGTPFRLQKSHKKHPA